jgi:hypothetical protein
MRKTAAVVAQAEGTVESRGGRVSATSAAQRLFQIHSLLAEVTSSPWSHDALELAIATAVSLRISEQDETALVWLLIVGAPSGDKTSSVLLLKKAQQHVYYADSVTENFLASGYRDELTRKRAPNLLEELNGKCLVLKELSTVFSLHPQKVKKFLGDLLAIFDREYYKLTGTLGRVGGTSAFSMVACITPVALLEHHEYMSRIGPRFLAYRLPQLTDSERAEGLAILWDATKGGSRKAKLGSLGKLVAEHIESLMAARPEFELERPDEQNFINRLGELVAHGRAVVRRERVYDPETGREGYEYEPELAQREEPFRAQQQLRNLARALCWMHGRSRVGGHELELVRRVALGSLPAGRAEVLALLPAHPRGLTAKACSDGIGKSPGRARQLLDELAMVGLVMPTKIDPTGGRPEIMYAPVGRFADLLTQPMTSLDHLVDLHERDFLHNSGSRLIHEEPVSCQTYEKSPVHGTEAT